MTDQEIMQALRLCRERDSNCRACNLWGDDRCVEHLAGAAVDLIERLTAENAALREQAPQWISCKDKLPPLEQMVLVRTQWGHICDRALQEVAGLVLFRPDGLFPIKHITHWMPLPGAPEEGGKHGTTDNPGCARARVHQ